MAVLSFVSMYVLMYAMVNAIENVFPNWVMTAPMVIIELSLMSAMYKNRSWNGIIVAVSATVLIMFFAFIR